MSKRSHHKKQLSLNDRSIIHLEIETGMSAIEIAKKLGVSRQTVYREIKRNRKSVQRRTTSNKSVYCKHRNSCSYKACMRHAGFTLCFQKCEHYEDGICEKLLSFPFCCNTCSKKTNWNSQKHYYNLDFAVNQTINRRKNSRKGLFD